MLEGLVADVLSRLLGQYVEGISREGMNLGIWRGNLQLRDLALRSEALEVLFETLGIDLPVTVRQGFVGLLRLEVPWKRIRSSPVRVVMSGLTIVACPSSDADRVSLEERAARLKKARLATDDAIREARWGTAGIFGSQDEDDTQTTNERSSWGWTVTGRLVAKVVDNIQVEIQDIMILYEDVVSEPGRPFAARMSLKQLEAKSANSNWEEEFLEDQNAPLVHKRVELTELTLDWYPIVGQGGNSSTSGGDSESLRTFVMGNQQRIVKEDHHVISPLNGTLKATLVRPKARSVDKATARVNLDLQFPEFELSLDDFQYGTFLSMLAHLNEFQRTGTKATKPETAKERWAWAVEQILPNHSQYFRLAWIQSPDGMCEYSKNMSEYVRIRLRVLKVRRSSRKGAEEDARKLESMEDRLALSDILIYRDTADYVYSLNDMTATAKTRILRYFPRKGADENDRSSLTTRTSSTTSTIDRPGDDDSDTDSFASAEGLADDILTPVPDEIDGFRTKSLRLGVLIHRGCIRLSSGGDRGVSFPFSDLRFRELQIGVETSAQSGARIDGLLADLIVTDCENSEQIWVSRAAMARSALDETLGVIAQDAFPEGVVEALLHLKREFRRVDSKKSFTRLSKSASAASFQSEGSSKFGSSWPGSPSSYGEVDLETLDRVSHAEITERYIATMRIDIPGEGSVEAPQLDLAIAGLTLTLNGPMGSFARSCEFWVPKETTEPLVHLLSTAAAARLASLRLRLQQALLIDQNPMLFNIVVNNPRIIVPGTSESQPALVADLGRFVFESVWDPNRGRTEELVSYIDYSMSITETGLFVIPSKSALQKAQRIMKPVTIRIGLRALRYGAFVAAAAEAEDIKAARTLMNVQIPNFKICIHQKTYRQLLVLAKAWGRNVAEIGRSAMAVATNISEAAQEVELGNESPLNTSALIDLEVDVELCDASVELRDRLGRSLILGRCSSTHFNISRKGSSTSLRFFSRRFSITDGTRGSTAPFRKIAEVGVRSDRDLGALDTESEDANVESESPSESNFLDVLYTIDRSQGRQDVEIRCLSLSMAIVQETVVELARFAFETDENRYSDPFAAAGVSLAETAIAIRDHGREVVGKSVAALSEQGLLSLDCSLGGLSLLLATTDGAIAQFEVADLKSEVSQDSNGAFYCSGKIGGFSIMNLTSNFAEHRAMVRYEAKEVDDGWNLHIPEREKREDPWLRAKFTSLRIIFVQRFLRIMARFIGQAQSQIREFAELSEESTDWGEFFSPMDTVEDEEVPPSMQNLPRLRISISTADIDIAIPRNSMDCADALRVHIPESYITNEDVSAEGYKIGFELGAKGVATYILHPNPTENEPQPTRLDTPLKDLSPFSKDGEFIIKVDWWRKGQRLDDVEQIRALLDKEEMEEHDAHYRLPSIRLRCFAPNGLQSRMSELDYGILYLVLTDNFFERAIQGEVLACPASPEPDSIQLPPFLRVLFEVPSAGGITCKGIDHTDEDSILLDSRLCNVTGRVDYGMDSRLVVSISGDVAFVQDARPSKGAHIDFVAGRSHPSISSGSAKSPLTHDIDFSYDRPYGRRANLMLVVSGLKINVVPELALQLGDLLVPGNPYLKTTSFPELPYFNGRTLIITVSDTDVMVYADEFPGDTRAVVARGEFLTKFYWKKETRERSMELICRSMQVSLSEGEGTEAQETSFIYPCEITGAVSVSEIMFSIENLLARVAVQDSPLFVAIAARILRAMRDHRQPDKFSVFKVPIPLEEPPDNVGLSVIAPATRLVFTDEQEGKVVPILEARIQEVTIEGRLPWMVSAQAVLSIDLFNDQKGWWVPGVEPWNFNLTASVGRSGSRAIALGSDRRLDFNCSPVIVYGCIRVGQAINSAIQGLRIARKDEDCTKPASKAESSSSSRRPSVAAFCVRNEIGRPILMWLPKRQGRNQVHSGDEVEVDILSDQVMLSASTGESERENLLQCYLSLSGYEPRLVSVSEVGIYPLSLIPDREDEETRREPITVLWDVVMRDGVPVGTLRSLLRFKNETRTPIQMKLTHTGEVRTAIQPGGIWCVPLSETEESFRFRPGIDQNFSSGHADSGACAKYSWCDNFEDKRSFRKHAYQLAEIERSSRKLQKPAKIVAPVSSCKSVFDSGRFDVSVYSVADFARPSFGSSARDSPEWIDVSFRSPLVIENLLPRKLSYKLAVGGRVCAIGEVAPLDEEHIHNIGGDMSRVTSSFSFENATDSAGTLSTWGDEVSLASSERLPLSSAKNAQKTLFAYAEWIRTTSGYRVRIYAPFWIRNRSDQGLTFRDCNSGDYYSKIWLPPRERREMPLPFVCFSGRYLEFFQGESASGSLKEKWIAVSQDLNEVDKFVPLSISGASLILEVRPAKGRFLRTLVVTVRCQFWIENLMPMPIQWCEKSSLDKRGILLSSSVHVTRPGEIKSLHVQGEDQAICVRPADDEGQSDWIWSLPISVFFSGELPTKMYRPKTREQYIARTNVSIQATGVTSITIYPEDRDYPPYRIVNDCQTRSIAFRQVGSNKAHPWLIRAGKSTRYTWDDPTSARKKKMLIIEVIDLVDDEEIHYPEFLLNIDIVSELPSRIEKGLMRPLQVNVTVDGPTKVVRFWDCGREHEPEDTEETKVPVVGWADISDELDEHSASPKEAATDIEIWIPSLGVSVLDSLYNELVYIHATGIRFHLDLIDGAQLILFQVEDVQVDNQLHAPSWPVLLWSPPSNSEGPDVSGSQVQLAESRSRKPVVQVTIDKDGRDLRGITMCRGFFVAIQQLEINADEDFLWKGWEFYQTIVNLFGIQNEDLLGLDEDKAGDSSATQELSGLHRLYVQQVLLCPIKVRISFASSRSATVPRFGGYRSLVRTLIAVLGNVENAELKFNALELQHAFDTASHFRSLVSQFYVRQVLKQRFALVTSNNLVGNPSALFDSISTGAKDFFFEPAKAKDGLDFLASLGRGSQSLLANTVGGIFGSIGGIPRVMAQGLESAVGDKEYLSERASIRGSQRTVSNPAQGLYTGALSFGHSLASGAAGLIRDPIEGAMNEGTSGFFKGLGRGVMGGVLKPLTGALDLIAEPAAGFRSMVSVSTSGIPEPVRPPRLIAGGPGARRLVLFDFRASLGKSFLDAVNRGEPRAREHIVDWVELTSEEIRLCEGRMETMWMLVRRFTRGDGRLGRLMKARREKGPDGETRKPEKDRVALLTNQRLVVATLEGTVIWECPLRDVVDSRISQQGPDFLLVGALEGATHVTWNRVDCGSQSARDALHNLIKNKIAESSRAQDDPRGVELSDLSAVALGREGTSTRKSTESNEPQHVELEMSDLSRHSSRKASDVSESGRFTREFSRPSVGVDPRMVSVRSDIERVIERVTADDNAIAQKWGRSVRAFVVNRLPLTLNLVRFHADSGVWLEEPPQTITSGNVGIWKVDGACKSGRDIRGYAIYEVEGGQGNVFLGFVNPLLAANSFPIRSRESINVWYEQGQGSNASVIFSISSHSPSVSARLVKDQAIAWKLPSPRVLPDADDVDLGSIKSPNPTEVLPPSSWKDSVVVRKSNGSDRSP